MQYGNYTASGEQCVLTLFVFLGSQSGKENDPNSQVDG